MLTVNKEHPCYLHGTALFVLAPVCCRLKAVGDSLTMMPVFGSQVLHEVLQTHHTVVLLQRLQLEILIVRDVHLLHRDTEEKHSSNICSFTYSSTSVRELVIIWLISHYVLKPANS